MIQEFGINWKKVTPASKKCIEKIEEKVKTNLPVFLEKLLIKCAGGFPKENFFESEKYDIELSIGYILYGCKDKNMQDILSVRAKLIELYDFPENLLPFAHDSGHANQICLDLNTGEVFYWLRDDPETPKRKVSDSLEFFIQELIEEPF